MGYKTIEIPGMGPVDFPDSMTSNEITEAAGELYDQQNGGPAKVPKSQTAGPNIDDWMTSLAAEQGPVDSALIGAGRAFTQLGRGVGDLFGNTHTPDPQEEAAYQALQKQRPIATAIGESAPYVTGGLGAGAALRGAGLAANLGGQAGTGAAIGGASYAPTGEERLTNAAIEGTLGLGGEVLGRTAARVIGGLGVRPAAEGAMDVAQRAQNLGYKVLPSTRAEADMLGNVVEGGLEATPGGALRMDAITGHNQDILNRSAAQAIGEAADAPTDTVTDNAFRRIGGEFNRLMSDQVIVPVDDDLLNAVLRIDEDRIAPMLVGPQDPVRDLVNKTFDLLESGLQRGGLTAREIQAHQSRLGKTAWAQRINNPELSHALGELQDELLGSAMKAMPPAERAALRQARKQYRNLMTITNGSNTDLVTGKVHAGRVKNYLKRRDRVGFGRGQDRNPFYEGVRFLSEVQPPKKSSGTAERQAIREVMKFGGIGAGAGVAGGQDIESTLAGGGLGVLGAIVAPNVAARMYLRPGMQNYLTREMGPLGQQMFRGTGIGGLNILDQIIQEGNR